MSFYGFIKIKNIDDIDDIEMNEFYRKKIINVHYGKVKRSIYLRQSMTLEKLLLHIDCAHILYDPDRYEFYKIHEDQTIGESLYMKSIIKPGETIAIADLDVKYWKLFIIYPGKYHIKYPAVFADEEPVDGVKLALDHGACYVETQYTHLPTLPYMKLDKYWWPGTSHKYYHYRRNSMKK